MTDRDNEYQIVIRLPKADGFHHRTDWDLASTVVRAIGEGLRDRFVETGLVSIEKVPPRKDRADIPVGTRVMVTPLRLETAEPYAARVAGYDLYRTKYRLDFEFSDGRYAEGGHTWAFVNQVELHPDETAEGATS